MSWDEFLDLTLAELEALELRRSYELRQARYNAALITSAIFNTNRAPNSRPVSPFDFIAGFEDPEDIEKAEKRRELKRSIALVMVETPRAKAAEMRATLIARLKVAGHEDAEDIYLEVFKE